MPRTLQHIFQENTPNYKSNFTFYVLDHIFRSEKACYVLRKKSLRGRVKAVNVKRLLIISSLTSQSAPPPDFTEMKQGTQPCFFPFFRWSQQGRHSQGLPLSIRTDMRFMGKETEQGGVTGFDISQMKVG